MTTKEKPKNATQWSTRMMAARVVLSLLAAASTDYGQTIAMVTHDPTAASYADRILFLADGALTADRERSTPEEISAYMLGMERQA